MVATSLGCFRVIRPGAWGTRAAPAGFLFRCPGNSRGAVTFARVIGERTVRGRLTALPRKARSPFYFVGSAGIFWAAKPRDVVRRARNNPIGCPNAMTLNAQVGAWMLASLATRVHNRML